jgi:hypothetical protein
MYTVHENAYPDEGMHAEMSIPGSSNDIVATETIGLHKSNV